MKKLVLVAALLAAVALVPQTASADQIVFGSFADPLGRQVDVYNISISAPALFSATITAPVNLDTVMWLFSAAGVGLIANDDTINPGPPWTPTSIFRAGAGVALAAGNYMLYVSTYLYAPVDTFGTAIFPGMNVAYTNLIHANNSNPLAGWALQDSYFPTELVRGDYTLSLVSADIANVPEPATLSLLGLGLVGIARAARRKKA